MDLNGKTALVTGASRGIGRAVALALAKAGARVALTARTEEGLRQTADEIMAAGGDAVIVPGDALDGDAIARVVEGATAKLGRLDVLVNNAGMIDPIARVDAADADAWNRCMAVNLTAPALFARHALPALRESGGAIVNVSSGAAHRPLEGWAAYCASKAGLWMLTQALHLEEGDAVDVYGASPGTVDTEMQGLIRASGVNPVSQIPQGDLAPAALPAAGIAWLAAARPDDLRGSDVNVRDASFLKRAGIA